MLILRLERCKCCNPLFTEEQKGTLLFSLVNCSLAAVLWVMRWPKGEGCFCVVGDVDTDLKCGAYDSRAQIYLLPPPLDLSGRCVVLSICVCFPVVFRAGC